MNNQENPQQNILANSDELSFLPIYKLVDENLIVFDIKNGSKQDILMQLTSPLIDKGYLKDTNALVKNLIVREEMAATTISKGVAFPHCRKSSDNPKNLPPLILGISKEGVEYNEKNNAKTHIFFLILVEDEVLHLRILSKLARFVNREKIVDKLINLKTKNEIINFLMETEYENMA